MIDYKFNYIIDEGVQKECKVSFYEGEYRDVETENGMEKRYIRTRKLRTQVFFFSPAEDIRKKLNKMISKEGVPIPEQNVRP